MIITVQEVGDISVDIIYESEVGIVVDDSDNDDDVGVILGILVGS